MFLLSLSLLACSDKNEPLDTSADTGGADTGLRPVERETDCSGMDPADAAPLGGWMALTFDDGPDPEVTPQILAMLRKYEVPATFFMLGQAVEDPANEALVAEIIADPLFDVANHSYDHSNLALLSADDATEQITSTTAALEALGGSVEFLRFPYGVATCELVDEVREEHGLLVAGWHIDTADWCYALGDGTCTSEDYWRIPAGYESDMYGWTLDQLAAFDGGVFLYHDVHQYTADELEEIILTAESAGYTFTHLSDADAFPLLNAGTPYDFPWVGEACAVSEDTCWQVEYLSWCEETQPAEDVGMCVLDCTTSQCIDRDGAAPLFCAETAPGEGTCLPFASAANGYCDGLPGTVSAHMDAFESSRTGRVCLPESWQ